MLQHLSEPVLVLHDLRSKIETVLKYKPMLWSTEENLKILKLPKKINQSPSTLQEKAKDIETAQKYKPTMSVYTHCWFLRIQKSRTDEKVKVFARPGDILRSWSNVGDLRYDNDYDYNYDFDYDNEYTWTFMQGPLPHFVVIIRVHEWSSHLCPERLPQAARVGKAELSLEPDEKPAEAEIQIPRFLEI